MPQPRRGASPPASLASTSLEFADDAAPDADAAELRRLQSPAFRAAAVDDALRDVYARVQEKVRGAFWKRSVLNFANLAPEAGIQKNKKSFAGFLRGARASIRVARVAGRRGPSGEEHRVCFFRILRFPNFKV